jgi:hypothetical protein
MEISTSENELTEADVSPCKETYIQSLSVISPMKVYYPDSSGSENVYTTDADISDQADDTLPKEVTHQTPGGFDIK